MNILKMEDPKKIVEVHQQLAKEKDEQEYIDEDDYHRGEKKNIGGAESGKQPGPIKFQAMSSPRGPGNKLNIENDSVDIVKQSTKSKNVFSLLDSGTTNNSHQKETKQPAPIKYQAVSSPRGPGNKLNIGNDSVDIVKQSTKSKNVFSLLDSGTTNNSHQKETKQPAPIKYQALSSPRGPGNKLNIGNDSVDIVKQSTKSKNVFSLLDSGTTNNSHQKETKQPAPIKYQAVSSPRGPGNKLNIGNDSVDIVKQSTKSKNVFSLLDSGTTNNSHQKETKQPAPIKYQALSSPRGPGNKLNIGNDSVDIVKQSTKSKNVFSLLDSGTTNNSHQKETKQPAPIKYQALSSPRGPGNKLNIGNDSVDIVKQSTKSKNAFSLLDSGTINNSHQEETKQPAPTKILSKVTDIDSTQSISSKIQHKEEIDEEGAKSFMINIFQEYLEGNLEEFESLGAKYEREDFFRIIIPLFFSALADSKADLMKKLPICLTEYLRYLYSEDIITIRELTKGISLYIQNYYENEVSEAPQFPEALEGVICNLLRENLINLEELEIFPNKKELDEDDFLDERMKLNIGIVNRLKIEEIITDREQLVGYWERTGKKYSHMKENYMLETE